MILTGQEILKQIDEGNIEITPFDSKRINPNSYNLTLNNKLLVYADKIIPRLTGGGCDPFISLNKPLDMKSNNPYRELEIPETGMLLKPGIVYLGMTNEFTATDKFVPMLEGRSSIGRLGLHIHITAGFGDIGYRGKWTLEIVATQPIIIYPNVEICQIYYHVPCGDTDIQYVNGKYQNVVVPKTSELYKEFE